MNGWLNPASLNLVCGKTCSGKTELLARLLEGFELLYGPNSHIGKVVLIYNIWQDVYDRIINSLPSWVPVLTFKGIQPEIFSTKTLTCPKGYTVIIFDDQLSLLQQSKAGGFEKELKTLATALVHHLKLNCWFIYQSSSFKSPVLSSLFQNCSYIYLTFWESSLPTHLASIIQVGILS